MGPKKITTLDLNPDNIIGRGRIFLWKERLAAVSGVAGSGNFLFLNGLGA